VADGDSLEALVNVADFERVAEGRLEAGTFGYFAGGAGDERTLRDNVAAWGRWQLRPRVLVDVDEATTRAEVLGGPCSMPVLVAPVAFQRLAHPDGEVAMARAAAAAGTVFTLSTIATSRPSEVAEQAPGGRRWFQLYCFRDAGVTQALLEEAVDSGFEAIVLTVDAPRAGRRERDFRTGFAVPPGVGVPSLDAVLGGGRAVTVQEVFAQVDASLGWADVGRLAADCSVPVLVKGVHTGEDARLALEHGAAGVVVSNHGGRQLDGVAATADVLPEVAAALEDRGALLVDGGVRRGADAVVALALGAEAVLVGRPALWGLAAGGEEGARRVLALLREELELALVLCGCASPGAVTPEHAQRALAPPVYSPRDG
jgi:isopentenyl diphosphate isomerase/L-lactate dehydrogenase-like FMN-dependent dehydrogenase